MDLKQLIINYSKQIGIDLIGFTDSKVNDDLILRLKQKEQLNFLCSFENYSIEEKTNPALIMDDVKTIMVVGLSYPKTCNRLKQIRKEAVYFGNCSWGEDYHRVLRRKLNRLASYIKNSTPNFTYQIVVDTSPLDERYFAYQSGLGFYGKNGLLINQEYGSYFFIGLLLTNLELKKDKPLNKGCLGCNICLAKCPTQALNETGLLNSKRCLSYITQKRGVLTDWEKRMMNNCIYGCDICQRCCPYNKEINSLSNKEFIPSDLEFINALEYQPLSNKEFKTQYGLLTGSWRGKKIIERNIWIYKEKHYYK